MKRVALLPKFQLFLSFFNHLNYLLLHMKKLSKRDINVKHKSFAFLKIRKLRKLLVS